MCDGEESKSVMSLLKYYRAERIGFENLDSYFVYGRCTYRYGIIVFGERDGSTNGANRIQVEKVQQKLH